MRKPELLIPAGNLEKLSTALLYGADAVYIGVPGLSLRASSAELSFNNLASGVSQAHGRGVKVYAAINTFARNTDIPLFRKTLPGLIDAGVDALIVSDPGLIRLIHQIAPAVSLHLSTQANTTNIEAVRFWQDRGVRRIIVARELSLKEIGEIARAVPDMELEIFIHGAMCVSYSGRCYLSAWRNRKSANEGDCTHPCRWEYVLHESTRPDDPLILEEDERFSYLLSSKDLCLIEHLPYVLAAGVSSLKVEGRMKSPYYVAVVTRTYRQALNALMQQKERYLCEPQWIEELKTISHRGYTTGFAFAEEKIQETSPLIKNIQTHEPAGIVLNCDQDRKRILVDVRNHLEEGDRLEVLLPEGGISSIDAVMTDENGNRLQQANSGNRIYLHGDSEAPAGTMIRKRIR
jgi:putative protease